TATYEVAQTDINTGTDIINVAEVTTTERSEERRVGKERRTSSTDDQTIKKTVDQSTIAAPGTLNYTITVTNTGNTDLTSINLTDAQATTLSPATESISSREVFTVGDTWVYTATYEVTQTDINTGTDIINVAEVTTTELPTPERADATTTITSTDRQSVAKTVDQSTSAAPGTLNYTITVSNTGNTDLTSINLTDAQATTLSPATESISSNGVLNVGENWVYTATYEVTQTDINNGSDIINIAQVTTDELPTPESADATTTITSTDALTITKTVDQSNVTNPTTLNYTITVTNTGNTDLTSINLTDALATTLSTATESISSNGVLNVGENWVYTATYEVTQTDINNGIDIVNVAEVTTTELPTPESADATTTITSNDALTITKTDRKSVV